jgi:predicted GIY-YIG superfamily endonuclease
MTGLYLLHLTPPYKHAKHYLGWAEDIDARVAEHRAGSSGVRLVEAAVRAGCQLELVRTWPDATRDDERAKKATRTGKGFRPRGSNSTGSRGRLCPLCKSRRKMAVLTSPEEPQTTVCG